MFATRRVLTSSGNCCRLVCTGGGGALLQQPQRQQLSPVVSRKIRTIRCLSSTTTTTATSSITTMSPSQHVPQTTMDTLWNPTDEHKALRSSLRNFVEREVESQADHFNKTETFNVDLFRQLGSKNLGILGLTVDEMYGGTGWPDATAVAIVHEELAYSDPAFCLLYLAHSLLFANNLSINASREKKFTPTCDGSLSLLVAQCVKWYRLSQNVVGQGTASAQGAPKEGDNDDSTCDFGAQDDFDDDNNNLPTSLSTSATTLTEDDSIDEIRRAAVREELKKSSAFSLVKPRLERLTGLVGKDELLVMKIQDTLAELESEVLHSIKRKSCSAVTGVRCLISRNKLNKMQ